MQTSTDRILTTHVGSLPRPQEVVDLLFAQERGDEYDAPSFDETMQASVSDVVRRQVDAGIDIVSDGETSKISYATYVRHRLGGFEPGNVPRATPQDLDDFPEYRDRIAAAGITPKYLRPICKGPVTVKDRKPLEDDIRRMRTALSGVDCVEAFAPSVSPGTVAVFQPDEYYDSYEAYLMGIADAMRDEYEAIVDAGFVLQLDCPDLGMGRHIRFRDADEDTFVRNAHVQVEALNHALENVPPERSRLHVCWGNYEGPHTRDVPLVKVLPALLESRVGALMIEAANPRHEHEWELWKTTPLPEDMILIPGVLDSTCNFVEHPELVAQRLVRFADMVGRERVIAGTDCGFGTFAGFGAIHPLICWEKLRSLAEGARIATRRLW